MHMNSSDSSRVNVDFYERFAEYYQRIYACVDADETVRQWKLLLDQHLKSSAKPLSLIDIGCGPGWHLTPWAKAGFEVIGIDSSPSMLAASQANFSRDFGRPCRVYLRDIRELSENPLASSPEIVPSPATFDVAVAHFNFLNLFASDDLLRVFHGVASLVRPGGIWVVDCSIPLSPPSAVREDYEQEVGIALRCIGEWSETSKTFRQRWLSVDTDIVEVYWFHCLQVYDQCAKSSGWVTESRFEWNPNERNEPWRAARIESDRVVTVYRRTAKDESIERNWGVEDGQERKSAGMADRET